MYPHHAGAHNLFGDYYVLCHFDSFGFARTLIGPHLPYPHFGVNVTTFFKKFLNEDKIDTYIEI